MTDKLKQIIKEETEKLPKENQEAISALDWVKIVEEIGKKYSLEENQINDLETETLLVLVGINDPQFFAVNVENQVETIKDYAKKISEEITKKIFIPVNEALVEKIKKSDKVKKAGAEQNLNFILSGGDYSAFLDESDNANMQESTAEDAVVPVFSITEENLKKSSV